ncbi:MAG: D-alanine--D-alanine ligase [Nonlabens sp.]
MENIAVLMGGISREREISLKSGRVIAQSLDPNRFNIFPVIIERDQWYHESNSGDRVQIDKNDFSLTIDGSKINFDCCYNSIHGTPGEDGLIQSYLELLNIPHTSSSSYASAITFNKRDCLAVLKPWKIPTGIHQYINLESDYSIDNIIDQVGLPCFVKANRSGSSYGVSKVNRREEMQNSIDIAFDVDDEIIVESYLSGMEVSVGVYQLNNEIHILPPTEIVTETDFFDYEAKYNGKSQEITPARLQDSQIKELQELTRKIYQVLKMNGIARADFIYHDNKPYFVEINSVPGMSKQSIIPQQVESAGLDFTDFLTSIIENSIADRTV